MNVNRLSLVNNRDFPNGSYINGEDRETVLPYEICLK
jgi:hypothetical protein